MSRTVVTKLLCMLLLSACLSVVKGNRRTWESPGCHLVVCRPRCFKQVVILRRSGKNGCLLVPAQCGNCGHTRTVNIPGCVPFEVTTNACRGFCLSYAFPSPPQTLAINRNLLITSMAECCGMVDTHEVKVMVACRDGYQQKTFKSARSCACSICRRTL